MNNNKYKEEIIKAFFDRFEDRYKCNEYILITHKSVSEALIGITPAILSNFKNEERCNVMYLTVDIVEQARQELNPSMTCGFYNTVKREFETDQDKINILQMITEGSLEIDEAEFRNKYEFV